MRKSHVVAGIVAVGIVAVGFAIGLVGTRRLREAPPSRPVESDPRDVPAAAMRYDTKGSPRRETFCEAVSEQPFGTDIAQDVSNAEDDANGEDESPWGHDIGQRRADPIPGTDAFMALRDAGRIGDFESVGKILHELAGNTAARRDLLRKLFQSEVAADFATSVYLLWAVPRNTGVYRDCVRALETVQSPDMARWFAFSLGRVRDSDDAARLTDCLKAMRGRFVVEAIAEAYSSAEHERHRLDLLHVLRQRGSPEEVETMAELVNMGDVVLTEAAAAGMARIGGWEAMLFLADAADARVEQGIIANALAQSPSPFSQTALMALARNPSRSVSVRSAAIRGLAAYNSDRTRAALERLARAVSEPEVFSAVLASIDNAEPEAAQPVSREYGVEKDDDERWFR